MKKIISVLLAAMICISSFTSVFALSYGEEYIGDNGNYNIVYTDVDFNHWAYEETKRCKEQGWFSGYPDGRFMPEAPITRAEAIKVIVSFMGRKLEDVRISNYHDVDVNEWYAPYIHAGEDLFPIKWKNGNAFQPDMPMTREDTVYALVVALGFEKHTKFADESILNMFTDKNSISNIMCPYFAVAVSNGLVSGYHDNTIRAQDALTRAQFAALLSRATTVGPQVPEEAKLQTISIMPSSRQNITVGDSFTFTGKATYSDNTQKEYRELKPYDSDYTGVVRIEDNTIIGVKEGTCVIKFDCQYTTEPNSVTVTVNNPTDAPKIKTYNVPDSIEDEYYTIKGTVTDKTGTEIDLSCNGKDVMLSGNEFEHAVRLNIGKNEFKFVAQNAYGNTSESTVTIYREEGTPPMVQMQDVTGMGELNAKSIIESLGLGVCIETVWDDSIAQGIVVKQSVEAGKEIEYGKIVTITVSGGKNEWVGWNDSLPSYINAKDYIIEEKTQYRSKELERKTSSASLSGNWVLDSTDESWGNWSQWSRSSVSSSSTREVQSQSVADPKQTKTQWHYTRYYGWNPNKGAYVSWPWNGTYSNTYQESGWLDSPMENRGRADDVNATCYKRVSDPISVWWWNETTRTVELPTTYHTEYRYRDKVITYNYSRWSDWSDWQDTAIKSNDSTQVETKVLYRYKFK